MTNALRSLLGAESEVQKLERDVARWSQEAESKQAELLELQRLSGAAVTADDPAAAVRELAVQSQELRIWIDGARGAAEAAQERLVVARWDLDEARAAEMRDKAAKLTAKADAHQAKVDALLVQLRELEGVDYTFSEPTDGEVHYALGNGGRFEWNTPQSWALRNPIQPLLDEAAELEASVSSERAAALQAVSPVVPRATINVPAWDDVDTDSHVFCEVSEGVGSVTFDVGGEQVTLPDGQGNRKWGRAARIQAGGGALSIRANGEVLADVVRPGSMVTRGAATVVVDSSRCPSCTRPAPVVGRGPSKTDNPLDGPVAMVACQVGCNDGKPQKVEPRPAVSAF